MTDGPMFSVVSVTRNDCAGLRKTYDSLIAQEGAPSFEWIVIDGASTDGTVEFLKSLSPAFPVDWISEPDQGIYDAMNKGQRRSRGDYLLFLNGGDALADESVLCKVAENGVAKGADFIYGDALESTPDGALLYKKARSARRAWWGMFTHHQAMFYRRSSVDGLLYDLRFPIGADYAYTLEALGRARKTVMLPFVICIFEQGGASSQSVSSGLRDQWRIRRDVMGMSWPFRALIWALKVTFLLSRRWAPNLYRRIRFSKYA